MRSAAMVLMAITCAACRERPAPTEERYADGSRKARGVWAPGDDGRRRVGQWTFWYPNGQKKAEGDYAFGRDDGRLDELGIPVDGQRGEWLGWYENGQRAFAYRLDGDGRHVGLSQRWHKNGKLAVEASPPDRNGRIVVRQWRADGTTWLESSQDADGELDGNLVEWDGAGDVVRVETYEHGKPICRGKACRAP
ncbi:MAG: hypothetical protein HY903_07575 [Deltaproteobacteria bacterium]|nr:hypothetical protein [Deltaproteobacteria bacterium]